MTEMEDQAQKFQTLFYVLSKFKKRQPEVQAVIAGIHEKGSLAGGLRVRVITLLESLYRPVERPTPFQKLHARLIISLKQGFDGDIAECFYCNQTGDVRKGFQNHHEDYKTWNNVLPNLHCAHPGCNTAHSNKKASYQRKVKPSVLESVSVSPDRTHPNQDKDMNRGAVASRFTSNEGERHDKVRTRFDKFVLDTVNGPFSVPANKRRAEPQFRMQWPLEKLSKWLVNVPSMKDGNIKLSSVTFRRWLEEDGEGPEAPLYIDESEKPYQVFLKETYYQAGCKKAGIPEAEYKVKEQQQE